MRILDRYMKLLTLEQRDYAYRIDAMSLWSYLIFIIAMFFGIFVGILRNPTAGVIIIAASFAFLLICIILIGSIDLRTDTGFEI